MQMHYQPKLINIIVAGLLAVSTLNMSCGKKEAAPAKKTGSCTATYASDIRTIVNAKCAIQACHDGSSALINFSTYPPLKERADNGRIRSYLFELKIMPPANSAALTDEEKNKVKCWLDNGASEN